MRLDETINDLLAHIKETKFVKTCAYGELEAYDTFKDGVEYPRAYLHLSSASMFTIKLDLIVSDLVANDWSDRLEADARALDILVGILRKFRDKQIIKEIEDIEIEATGFLGGDQSTGFKATIDIHLGALDTCPLIIK